jgi:uncharacterized protein YndB with AHSA1/START domain
MSADTPDDTRLILERVIPTTPDELFELWVDPAQLVKWWAPEGYQCDVDELDTRPGGRWRTRLRKPGGRPIAISGVYRAIEPPRHLTFTWAWEDDDGARGHETEVRVTFRAVPGGTHLQLIHQTFDSKTERDRHSFGWSSCFDRIARIHATA